MVAKLLLLLSTFGLPTNSLRVDVVDLQNELSATESSQQLFLNSSENTQPSPLHWLAKRMEEKMGWHAGTLTAPNLKMRERLASGKWYGVKGGGHKSTDTKWLFDFGMKGDDLDVSALRLKGSTEIVYKGKINANALPNRKGKQDENGWEFQFSMAADSDPSSLHPIAVTLSIRSLAQCTPQDKICLFDVMFLVQGDTEWGYLFDVSAWNFSPDSCPQSSRPEFANLAGICQASRFYNLRPEQKEKLTIEEQTSKLPLANEVPGWMELATEIVRGQKLYAGGLVAAGPRVPQPLNAQPKRSAMKGSREKAQMSERESADEREGSQKGVVFSG